MSGLIAYPIVLRGTVAKLLLPSDLTRGDVDRIVAMLETLVLPWPRGQAQERAPETN